MRKFYLFLFVLLVAAAALPAFAAGGEVIIGDQVVLRIRADAGGYSVQKRVDTIYDRLNPLLGYDEFVPEKMVVARFGSDATVSYDGRLIVTVDPETAKLNGFSTLRLAEIWAANLREAIPKFKAVNPDGPSI